MPAGKFLKARKSLRDLMTIGVCLCAFAFSSFPPLVAMPWLEVAENTSPTEQDGGDSEEKIEVSSSSRHRLKKRRGIGRRRRFRDLSFGVKKTPSFASVALVVIGYELSPGLCAPLLV